MARMGAAADEMLKQANMPGPKPLYKCESQPADRKEAVAMATAFLKAIAALPSEAAMAAAVGKEDAWKASMIAGGREMIKHCVGRTSEGPLVAATTVKFTNGVSIDVKGGGEVQAAAAKAVKATEVVAAIAKAPAGKKKAAMSQAVGAVAAGKTPAAAAGAPPAAGGVVGPPGTKLTPEQTKKLTAMKEKALEKIKEFAVYIASKIKGRDPKQTEKVLLDKFVNLEKKVGTEAAITASNKLGKRIAAAKTGAPVAAAGAAAAGKGPGKKPRKDILVLQTLLKKKFGKKIDLGTTGKAGVGVDGVYGGKTQRAINILRKMDKNAPKRQADFTQSVAALNTYLQGGKAAAGGRPRAAAAP